MEYSKLLDLAADLGYELAMSGAETFRVEDSIRLVLKAYDIDAEVFVIPNCMHISIEPVIGRPLTRMRRIGAHGSDLDAVERFSGLSRRIVAEHPAPEIAEKWLREAIAGSRHYRPSLSALGYILGALGFCFLWGGGLVDSLWSGLCGLLIFLFIRLLSRLDSNSFFQTIGLAFITGVIGYGCSALHLLPRPDSTIIGALMLLVPGLLFTNAMRDIIFGDTNSGINRIVQVLLIAIAIALGTGAALNLISSLPVTLPESLPAVNYNLALHGLFAAIGCLGFAIVFNIHGPGALICTLGGVFSWVGYLVTLKLSGGSNDLLAYFIATLISAVYAEIMARVRKYPAISYLVVAIFPLIPGAGVYYAMREAVTGNMDAFAEGGMHTAGIAGVIAVGILLVSTSARIITTLKRKGHRKR